MAQGMKRLAMPIAALFGVAVLALIGTSWFLNRDALRQAVEAQIRGVTGLDLIVSGAIDVSAYRAAESWSARPSRRGRRGSKDARPLGLTTESDQPREEVDRRARGRVPLDTGGERSPAGLQPPRPRDLTR